MGLSEVIEDLVARYGSLNAASRKADIPLGTLFAAKNGSDPRLTTLRKIAAGLDMTLAELAVKIDQPNTGIQSKGY